MSEVNAEKVVCKQCGFEFQLSEEEANKFLEKGLDKPKRCRRCRKENKLNQKIRDEVAKQLSELNLNK